jgi:hypothetical protein
MLVEIGQFAELTSGGGQAVPTCPADQPPDTQR